MPDAMDEEYTSTPGPLTQSRTVYDEKGQPAGRVLFGIDGAQDAAQYDGIQKVDGHPCFRPSL